jgi:hypothetical protein
MKNTQKMSLYKRLKVRRRNKHDIITAWGQESSFNDAIENYEDVKVL